MEAGTVGPQRGRLFCLSLQSSRMFLSRVSCASVTVLQEESFMVCCYDKDPRLFAKVHTKTECGGKESDELTHKRGGCRVEGSSTWDLGRFQMLPVGPFSPALSRCLGVALLDSFRSLQRELCLQRASCSACCIHGKHWTHGSVKIIWWAGKTNSKLSVTL